MTPAPADIILARQRAGHTAARAAELVHSQRGQTWLDWEAGRRQMPGAAWELYLLKTGQHPADRLAPRTGLAPTDV